MEIEKLTSASKLLCRLNTLSYSLEMAKHGIKLSDKTKTISLSIKANSNEEDFYDPIESTAGSLPIIENRTFDIEKNDYIKIMKIIIESESKKLENTETEIKNL